jgi:hypothetical protein
VITFQTWLISKIKDFSFRELVFALKPSTFNLRIINNGNDNLTVTSTLSFEQEKSNIEDYFKNTALQGLFWI